jgi:hypothetical protein
MEQPAAPYTLAIVSVNGAEYPSAGQFASIEEAEKYIPRSFRGLGAYWRVWIWQGGQRVVRCTRAGPGGTGERWEFEPAPGAEPRHLDGAPG